MKTRTVLSLLALAFPVAACSAAPPQDGKTSSQTDPLYIGFFPPPPTLAQCEATWPQCTYQASSWAQAVPQTPYGGMQARLNYDWIQAMERANCTTPVWMFLDPNNFGSGGVMTACPASAINSLPPVPFTGSTDSTYADLTLNCDHCFPYGAPSGWVYLMWDPRDFSPGGCKTGGCAGYGGY
jgi:hypothetical protein